MIVALLTHAGDVRQAKNLLRWMARLGKKDCPFLLVADCGTPWADVVECQTLAGQAFSSFQIKTNKNPTVGWPAGPYSLFQALCEDVSKRFREPFLVMEPDAIPLKPDWLEKIREAYESCRQPCMGRIYEGTENFKGEKFMSGIAVYPGDLFERLTWSETPVHWDVHHRNELVPNAANTGLIRHFFGGPSGGLKFVANGYPMIRDDTAPLSWIPEEAVVFHRDKSQSLIRLLTQKLFNEKPPPIKVVFPVHAGDVQQAVRHAHWLNRLIEGKPWPHTAIVAFDRSTPITEVNTLRSLLSNCFIEVQDFSYGRAPIPGWPAAANWMFQNIAVHMSRQAHPWLLLEADACVLRRDWLDYLQTAYDGCGQPFFGPYVKGMAHLNGVMIYPSDAMQRLPSAMICVDKAWDYQCAAEMKPFSADASDLIQHVWTIMNGEPCEVGGGELPQNITVDQAKRWVKPGAVIFHRMKGTSLIEHFLNGFRL